MPAEFDPAFPDPHLTDVLSKALRGNPHLILSDPDTPVETLDARLNEALAEMWSVGLSELPENGPKNAVVMITGSARIYLAHFLRAAVAAKTANPVVVGEKIAKLKEFVEAVAEMGQRFPEAGRSRDDLRRFTGAAPTGIQMLETLVSLSTDAAHPENRDLISAARKTNGDFVCQPPLHPDWYDALLTEAMMDLRELAREMREGDPPEGAAEDFIAHAAEECADECRACIIAVGKFDFREAELRISQIPVIIAEATNWPFSGHPAVARLVNSANQILAVLEKFALVPSDLPS